MIEIYDVVLIPLIIGLVQLLKYTGLNKRLLPICSLVLAFLRVSSTFIQGI